MGRASPFVYQAGSDCQRDQAFGCATIGRCIAIRTVFTGGKFLPPEFTTRLAERRQHHELTPCELEILTFSDNTIKFHIASILAKLDVGDRTLTVTTAIKRGILLLN